MESEEEIIRESEVERHATGYEPEPPSELCSGKSGTTSGYSRMTVINSLLEELSEAESLASPNAVLEEAQKCLSRWEPRSLMDNEAYDMVNESEEGNESAFVHAQGLLKPIKTRIPKPVPSPVTTGNGVALDQNDDSEALCSHAKRHSAGSSSNHFTQSYSSGRVRPVSAPNILSIPKRSRVSPRLDQEMVSGSNDCKNRPLFVHHSAFVEYPGGFPAPKAKVALERKVQLLQQCIEAIESDLDIPASSFVGTPSLDPSWRGSLVHHNEVSRELGMNVLMQKFHESQILQGTLEILESALPSVHAASLFRPDALDYNGVQASMQFEQLDAPFGHSNPCYNENDASAKVRMMPGGKGTPQTSNLTPSWDFIQASTEKREDRIHRRNKTDSGEIQRIGPRTPSRDTEIESCNVHSLSASATTASHCNHHNSASGRTFESEFRPHRSARKTRSETESLRSSMLGREQLGGPVYTRIHPDCAGIIGATSECRQRHNNSGEINLDLNVKKINRGGTEVYASPGSDFRYPLAYTDRSSLYTARERVRNHPAMPTTKCFSFWGPGRKARHPPRYPLSQVSQTQSLKSSYDGVSMSCW